MIKTLIFSFLFLLPNILIQSQTFTRVTQGSFVNDGGASRSVNFVDYDNDGDLDIFVSNGKRFGQRNFVYNNSGGNFTRVLLPQVTSDSLPYDGGSWADFDNDGDLDLCVVTWYDSTNMLYRNDNGNFFLLTSSPIYINRGFSETCSWGDYDNDGQLDLFITNSGGTTWRNRLYKNTGSGNFTAVDTGAISLDLNPGGRGVNFVDIDNDNDLDIFVCSENNFPNICYRNNGAGYFTKIISSVIVNDGGHTWSSSWGDYDNDGDFDLFIARHDQQYNSLYRNNGSFNFTKITADTIVNDLGNYACSGWGDYDNDGDLDMFVTQAYVTPNTPLKNKLYKNLLRETGNASFEKITTGDIVNDLGYSYGFAWADWDGDGDLDLFNAKTYNENENNSAYLNNGNFNKWIEIKLTGAASNKSGIGAKIKVRAVINGSPVWQIREVDGQSGYCGQNLDQHFGLGNASVIDSVRVEWPSGSTNSFTNVSVNQIIRIVENQGIIGIQQIGNVVPDKFNLQQNYPNPFNPNTKIRFSIAGSSITQTFLSVYDLLGGEVTVLVNKNLMPGIYETDWNAADYSSGIYFYKLTAGDFYETKKMILVK